MKFFYVICPVSSDPEFQNKRKALVAIGDRYALEPLFPLERPSLGDIHDLGTTMTEAVFVLADLSFERPSCYFELGFAEASAKQIFLIAATATPIHQIGKGRKVFFFDDLLEYKQLISSLVSGL